MKLIAFAIVAVAVVGCQGQLEITRKPVSDPKVNEVKADILMLESKLELVNSRLERARNDLTDITLRFLALEKAFEKERLDNAIFKSATVELLRAKKN